MYKKQKNFEVKMRQRGLINMQTKEQFIGRHFGIRCIYDSCYSYRYILKVIVSHCILKTHCISDMQGMDILEL